MRDVNIPDIALEPDKAVQKVIVILAGHLLKCAQENKHTFIFHIDCNNFGILFFMPIS
jgi:hypothetical protein